MPKKFGQDRKNGTADLVVEATGELAQLVARVADAQTPIVVAQGGEPKAALVSMAEYARLKQAEGREEDQLSMQEWSKRAQALRADILRSRDNEPVDLDALLQDMRNDLEDRDAFNSGR